MTTFRTLFDNDFDSDNLAYQKLRRVAAENFLVFEWETETEAGSNLPVFICLMDPASGHYFSFALVDSQQAAGEAAPKPEEEEAGDWLGLWE